MIQLKGPITVYWKKVGLQKTTRLAENKMWERTERHLDTRRGTKIKAKGVGSVCSPVRKGGLKRS